MRTKKVKVETLSNDPANVRLHDSKNHDAIKASLQKFGQQKPIVVDRNGVVVAGNGTLAAAKDLGWKEISIVETDLEGVDATAFAIADNRTAELAAWDDEALAKTLASLQNDFDIDETLTGFDEKEIEELINNAAGLGEVVEDEVPEVPKEAITQVGDLWLLGAYYECEDCGKRYDYDEGKKMKDCPCG